MSGIGCVMAIGLLALAAGAIVYLVLDGKPNQARRVAGRAKPQTGADGGAYFDSLCAAVSALCRFVRQLDGDRRVDEAFAAVGGLDGAEMFDCCAYGNRKLGYLFFDDLYKCYRRMGYPLNLACREGLGLVMPVSQLVTINLTVDDWKNPAKRNAAFEPMKRVVADLREAMRSTSFPDELLLAKVLGAENATRELAQRYSVLMYRWASVLAKADGVVTSMEKDWLATMANATKEFQAGENVKVTGCRTPAAVHDEALSSFGKSQRIGAVDAADADPMAKLRELVGLEPVKEQIERLKSFIEVQRQRERHGLKTAPLSYHCVFTGNPGTGKTTVARIVAEIYRQLGVIEKGHLVETDRSGLVAEYVGQTAVKTNKIIDRALDGVLFIDEAYSLVDGGQNDYGREAIATLLKRMEDDRDRLVVILAGYTEDMKRFVESNPGLQSRFNRYVEFPDYGVDDLLEIFKRNLKRNEYVCSEEALRLARDKIAAAVAGKDRHFGNGRFVRNFFERTIERQAVRLSGVAPLTEAMLKEILPEDCA